MDTFQRIFEYMPDGLLVVDPEGRIQRANVQAARMFGYAAAEMTGMAVETLVPQRFRSRHVAHRDRYARDVRSRPMGAGLDLFGVRRDGTEFPVDIMLSPVDAGASPDVLCAVRDVSERRRADERFRSLLEAAPDAMVIVDSEGTIVLVNSQTERVFGYPRGELLGKPVEILLPERLRTEHPQHRRRYVAAPVVRPMGAGLELYGRRRDGAEFPVEISLSPIETHEGVLISSAIRDISDRKQAEHLLDSLHEKELLLKEIHHRVKNNLAVISSLFYLQAGYTTDEPTIKILRESQDRVRSMALVHETLYRSDNLAAVDFAAYARGLSERLVGTYGSRDGAVRLQAELESISMGIDLAIPCGLILNELITNALTHAFPDGREGTIHLGLTRESETACTLRVSDTGIGIPADLNIDKAASLGLRLIRSLTRQIEGQFELVRATAGTQARLTLEVR